MPDIDKAAEGREIERQNETPQTALIQSIVTMYERAFRLPAKPDCKELDEILHISPGELIDRDLRTCEKYLWALNQWTLYLRRERNLRLVHAAFDVKRPLKRMQATASLKAKGKSRYEKFARVTQIPGMKRAQLQADVAEAYVTSLDGFLDEAYELKQALKRIITTKQVEFEQAMWAKQQ